MNMKPRTAQAQFRREHDRQDAKVIQGLSRRWSLVYPRDMVSYGQLGNDYNNEGVNSWSLIKLHADGKILRLGNPIVAS
jgi:hypothetical protein